MKLQSILFAVAGVVTLTFPAIADDSPSALEKTSKGWIDLLEKAGPALEGWTRVSIPPAPKGKLKEKSQWSIDPKTGHLICEGNLGHEWLRWDELIGNGIYHVEWRFTPVEGKKGYNSGIYARNSADGTVWHQAQTGSASGGFLFGETPSAPDGKLTRINVGNDPKATRVKPAGEWNTFEITCEGTQLSLWVNGAVTAVFNKCEVPRGHVGIEAEGYRIEFRNVKLKPLP